MNTLAQLPELAFRAPKTTHAEHCGLQAFRIRPLERAVKDEVLARGRNRRRTARQRLRRRGHFDLFEHEHEGSPVVAPNIGKAPALRTCFTRRAPSDPASGLAGSSDLEPRSVAFGKPLCSRACGATRLPARQMERRCYA